MESANFTKYEKARILGARGLQIAMNAPLLIKIDQGDLEKIKFDALKIAEIELNSDILPISVKKPFPKKKEEKLKRAPEKKITEGKKAEIESQEEKEIVQAGEIMELANPQEEAEESEAPKGNPEIE
ncbi:DNA-directed RNA polymerase subunit K [archaeon]|jgi:DNA-directed RNA polymerase subunit K|nr:DNA-directed RNA polymerase subunit K [archaeon]MBT4373612.1 DNA-directed RNA polymerase subunit K [archaeon]MBT4532060.1 DNA-directed RNA polymerase subunit K [archaeon]MBT7001727.1 DNA-directed RNA polymerase subunit K [archaeon]MBT7282381.1 DNA-directed RNA polymerase subunit K [archaeon]